jgi:hypothetical protein
MRIILTLLIPVVFMYRFYVLEATMKKQLDIWASLYTILQALSVSAFERTLLFQLFAQPDYKCDRDSSSLKYCVLQGHFA